ncbi:hypothetical protein ABL78_6505 [Leptomonas seymouri]|uniref:Cullin neddylation domain-containing protein n=1 Tax=Leptomonas seymouri TaxID=5684 RepID=A0A0N1I0R1_LEPSE|nr:hypothetical protein ABL78_6505 [Leptomonas seymouri]|eukprot:KPI84450.1 hypothetical protein ABL78_6505 [Leptomonas seymouri]
MTVSLHDLIEEWEAIHQELYRTSLESHRRYPFPTNLFSPDTVADLTGGIDDAVPLPSSDSSIAVYARVYKLVSHVRFIAEDVRYNSFQILQHLLWVTIAAWSNQLAIASGGLVELPPTVRQLRSRAPCVLNSNTCSAAAAATSGCDSAARVPYPCPILSPLTFWDPHVLTEAADAAQHSNDAAAECHGSTSVRRTPSLRIVWAEAVQRIFSVWCTPTATFPSPPSVAVDCKSDSQPSKSDSPPSFGRTTASGVRASSARSHSHDAYVWVLFAQHYHRFKAILSLFFMRYNVLLNELEEQRQQRKHSRYEAGELPGGASADYPLTQPLRRHGQDLRVPSDVSATSAPSITARAAATENRNSNSNGGTGVNNGRATDDRTAAAPDRSSAPIPTTARLLEILVRSIEIENMKALVEATGRALVFQLIPPLHRARLRDRVLKAPQTQVRPECADEDAKAKGAGQGPPTGEESPLGAPGCVLSVFLDRYAMVGKEGEEEEEEEDGGDGGDKVMWSAPPSPLLSFTKGAEPPRVASLAPVGEHLFHDNAKSGIACKTTPWTCAQPVMGRVQMEEYVLRNLSKLLRMVEECRVYVLQRCLVEAGKHAAAWYGSQLASLLFEPTASDTASKLENWSNDGSGASASAAPTARSLAEANRILRETIQSYARLRTKLLFLNAGTTHYLEELTPWGRSRVLETLNAFLCGFCGVNLPSASPLNSHTTAADVRGTVSPANSFTNAPQCFTPINASVSAFARTWAIPLWIAMCEDAQHRLEALQKTKRDREDQQRRKTSASGSRTVASRRSPRAASKAFDTAEDLADARVESGVASEGYGAASQATPLSLSKPYTKGSAAGETVNTCEKAGVVATTEGQEMSVASGDLSDVVSRASSEMWLPSSFTTGRAASLAIGGRGDGLSSQNFAQVRGRSVDLRRALQQHQRGRVPFGPMLQRLNADVAMEWPTSHGGLDGSDGGGLESLYSTETMAVIDTSLFPSAAPANVAAVSGTQNSGGSTLDGVSGRADVNGADRAGVGEVGAAASRLDAAHDHGIDRAAPHVAPRFSRAEQLHQVATLPDEGFPSLMYLMPRRSHFMAQDKAAASVQQALFTRFSSDVQNYLTAFLDSCEAPGGQEGNEGGELATTAATAAAADASSTPVTAPHRKPTKRKETAARPAVAGDVRPLPQVVLARMVFLLNMTYAALQGGGILGSTNGQSSNPLMETGLTATGQELGAATFEQESGQYESVVSTTLSTPTSPAVLAIAAVRKGFQGFLASQEKRAVLTLAQALFGFIQEGISRQPPAVAEDAVDTILNMASLLNSKEMFVSLMKGYIAPQVMMCRSLSDIAVESRVVARMAYRLGSAETAPCMTLLLNLRLALSDPLNTVTAPPSLIGSGEDGRKLGGQEGRAGYNRHYNRNNGMTTADSQIVDMRDVCALTAAVPSRHGSFGLIHRMRVLSQVWWKPHTSILLSSRKLQRLWERYQLLDERIIDAVLRVEWLYDGHTEPFYGYGRIPGDKQMRGVGDKGERMRSSASDNDVTGGAHSTQSCNRSNTSRTSTRSFASATAANVLRGGTAAAVIQGFSSVLGNAVRRTGHRAGAFGNNESDDDTEGYSEAYGGLLTLDTLQRHSNDYDASNSSYRGSDFSSIGGGRGAGEYWDTSDGGQSNAAGEAASTTVPSNGELKRRQLRWPLGEGQLVFLIYPKGMSEATEASQAVQISGPPLALLVCQLMDRAVSMPYTFDKLHKALPVQAPKPLLAHVLHELVKAGVVTRSVPAGKRQYSYHLCDDVHRLRQRRVIMDVRAAAQQQCIARTLTAAESDDSEDSDKGSQRDSKSPASPAGAGGPSVDPCSDETSHNAARVHHAHDAITASASAACSAPAYSAERTRKINVCVVCIMKAERVLQHRELLERVAASLEDQFVVTAGQFKRCLTYLMEKEFLQRSEDGEAYIYLP